MLKDLKRKLALKESRVRSRYQYYEMKNIAHDLRISTPPSLAHWQSSLGWCAKAVDSLADRLQFRTFKEDNFNIMEVFEMNNPDTFFDSAILSALITSCSFVYISVDENNYPTLQVLDASRATGRIDPITGLLKEGYAILAKDDRSRPITEAHLEPNKTTIYQKGKEPEVFNHGVNYPLLVPILHRPDDVRPFGHSRISRACMAYTNAAIRTIKRAEISAEFFSFPQRWVVGTAQDAEPLDKWKASMSSLIEITKDDDGDRPTLGQFTQQSMTPHTDQLKMFAALFAGETGLTLDDLGFATENPSSAEAIKSSHENLRMSARKAQRNFGSGFLNVGLLAASLRDNINYERKQFYKTKAVWEPVFEPDMSALSTLGDGAIKINQAVPGFFNKENLQDMSGIEPGNSTQSFDISGLIVGD